ncbi:MAG TPA: RNA methyltransferase [Actinomycetes bacterium]|nr:RNA methyltransferase [Actinomycetes bacterium]
MASPELTDTRAPRVRQARRLARRAFRAQQRQFLAEGAQAVREALRAAGDGVVVDEVFVTAEAAERHGELVTGAMAAGVTVTVASPAVLEAISDTVTPQGLVAVCGFVDCPLGSVLAARPRLLALLAEVRDPGNAGSVVRAADAAGADGAVFSAGSVDPYNGKVVRTSVGGIFHLPIVTGIPPLDVVGQVREAGLQVLAADATGPVDLDEAERSGLLARPTAWLFGNEAWGLSDELRGSADAVVRIPIYGRAESLNLATAAALCLYASARCLSDDRPVGGGAS